MPSCSSHLHTAMSVSKTKETAERIAKAMKGKQIHALAMIGISSVGLTIPVSLLTGIPTIYIRKPKEDSHGIPMEFSPDLMNCDGTYPFPLKKEVKRVAFIDDLISSGATVNRVITSLKTVKLKLAHIYVYESDYWKSTFQETKIPVTNI